MSERYEKDGAADIPGNLWRPHTELLSLEGLTTLRPATGVEADHSRPTVQFLIPLYQRMYVWGHEQIRQLLADIYDSWQSGPNKPYFLGGILAVERYENPRTLGLEIIDGQQRLTTLWLLALIRCRMRQRIIAERKARGVDDGLKNRLRSFIEIASDEREADAAASPRLSFEVREYANHWLSKKLKSEESGVHVSSEDTADIDPAHEGEWALRSLEQAIEVIEGWCREIDDDSENFKNDAVVGDSKKRSFDGYLLTQATLLVTRVSPRMDLKHLFEVINDRSVQLANHEILKARLLDRLHWKTNDEDVKYWRAVRESCSSLWDACSKMDGYVENQVPRNKKEPGAELFSCMVEKLRACDASSVGGNSLMDPRFSPEGSIVRQEFQSEYECRNEYGLGEDWSLAEIVEGAKRGGADFEIMCKEVDEGDVSDANGSAEVRSIISFSMLLQHALRLWLYRRGEQDLPSIDDRQLLQYFDDYFLQELSEDMNQRAWEVRGFFELLWEVRWLFDLHVVKWVHQHSDTGWVLAVLGLEPKKQKNNIELQRADEEKRRDRGLSMLQSVLYHTQNPAQQQWLTPYLGYLHKKCFELQDGTEALPSIPDHPSTATYSVEEVESFLRLLDDGLNCARSKGRTLAERAWAYLRDPAGEPPEPDLSPLQDEYGAIPQYWFYKVDYILWLNITTILGPEREIPGSVFGDVSREVVEKAWKDFRMTARSSVEHIQPQTPHDPMSQGWPEDGRAKKTLHRLGNLALVSRRRNTEFGNRTVFQKRSQFLERIKAGDLVSPKLAWVYLYGGEPGSKNYTSDFSWTPEDAEKHERAILEAVNRYFWSRPSSVGHGGVSSE